MLPAKRKRVGNKGGYKNSKFRTEKIPLETLLNVSEV